jgi:hypothetical protein
VGILRDSYLCKLEFVCGYVPTYQNFFKFSIYYRRVKFGGRCWHRLRISLFCLSIKSGNRSHDSVLLFRRSSRRRSRLNGLAQPAKVSAGAS